MSAVLRSHRAIRPGRPPTRREVLNMSKIEENLMAWLRNAHAMEEQAETMLTALAGRTGDYPEVKALAAAILQP